MITDSCYRAGERLAPDPDKTMYVVNLFPSSAPLPRNMAEGVTGPSDFSPESIEDRRLRGYAAAADAVPR